MSARKTKESEPRPITVRLTPPVFAELEARAGDERGEGLPTVAQVAISRYIEICRREAPDLAEPEWNLIRDSLNGVWLTEELGGPSSVAFITAEIEDSIRLNKYDEKHGVDAKKLRAKMATWTYANKVAIVDAVERWWRENG